MTYLGFISVVFSTQSHKLLITDTKTQNCLQFCLKTAMPRLAENQRNQAVGMPRAGTSVNGVALHFLCSRQTIHNLTTRYATTGSVTERPRSGRPHATSRRDNHVITLTHLRNRFTQATVTSRRFRVTAQTKYAIVLDKIEFQFVRVDLIQVRF